MKIINKIKVQNIKGFAESDNIFDICIKSGKINILVAPNGFGKSSITTAFASLKHGKIEVEKENCYKANESLDTSLSIVEEGIEYIADKQQNKISEHFKIAVIHNELIAKVVSKNMGKFHSTYGYLGINDFEIEHKIPENNNIPYNAQEEKRQFGHNGKILPSNFSHLLLDDEFLCQIDVIYTDLEKFLAKTRIKEVQTIINSINAINGTEIQVKKTFDENLLSELKTEICYINITTYVQKYANVSELDLFLLFYLLQKTYLKNKTLFKAKVQRAKYSIFKSNFNQNLSIIGKTWNNVRAVEQKGRLIVKMPNASQLSYGQRDSLTLCIKLQKIKSEIKDGDNYILIIDEVFDYLDPVNMTVIQYYLSQLIDDIKDKCSIYPIIMTHLSPSFFSNYTFSPKKMNVIYLPHYDIQPSQNIKKLIAKRDEPSIKDDVSKYLLHYNTGEIAKRKEFKDLRLPEKWGGNTNFLLSILQELNKYLHENSDYDPYSVSIALRIRIEKLVYDKLRTEEERETFINTHMTKSKLEYAETILGELPDVYYILGIIYNETGHLKSEDINKPIIYRLQNIVIKQMIVEIFNYKSEDIVLSNIH